MAHNIQILQNGDACFVENGRSGRAWHGLGKVYDSPLTAVEALKGAHADWNVDSRSLYFPTAEWGKILMENKPMTPQEMMQYFAAIEDKKVNVRSDNEFSLGVVGKDYGIVQNADAFDFIDMLTTGKCGGETPTIETAGVLGDGQRIFVTAKFPEPIRMTNKDNDLIDMYLVFTTSHDGSGCVNAMVTPVRVVCNNTLNWAMKENSGKLAFRHTLNVNKRLDLTNKEAAKRAYECLHLYDVYKKHFEESLEQMAKTRLTDKQTEEILVLSLLGDKAKKEYYEGNCSVDAIESTRSKNIIQGVQKSIFEGIGQDIIEKGTALSLVNGVTTFYQNEFNWGDDTERKFDALIGGSVQNKLQLVYNNIRKAI